VTAVGHIYECDYPGCKSTFPRRIALRQHQAVCSRRPSHTVVAPASATASSNASTPSKMVQYTAIPTSTSRKGKSSGSARKATKARATAGGARRKRRSEDDDSSESHASEDDRVDDAESNGDLSDTSITSGSHVNRLTPPSSPASLSTSS
jgi:hypothetical protein